MIDDFYNDGRAFEDKSILVEIPRDGVVDIWEVSPRIYAKAARGGLATLIGSKQPRSSRRHPFLMTYLRGRLRKNGKLTAKDIWIELKEHEHDYPLRIKGRMPGTIWFNNDALEVSSLKHGGDGVFTFKTFREYVRACKNPPTRAK